MIVRFYRKPRQDSPILELVNCKGCVTPKLCKTNGKCDCLYEDQKIESDLIRKLDEEKSKEEASAYKSSVIRKSKGRNQKKV
jgi:hypothetical protein